MREQSEQCTVLYRSLTKNYVTVEFRIRLYDTTQSQIIHNVMSICTINLRDVNMQIYYSVITQGFESSVLKIKSVDILSLPC